MFKRQGSSRFPVWVSKHVSLVAGERPEAIYQAWLTEVIGETHFCKKHSRTKLIAASEKCWFCPVDCYGCPEPPYKPGDFLFQVVLACPSCRVAYAGCPQEFHESSFDSFDTSSPERVALLDKARTFTSQVNGHRCGFALFVGSPGTGKTRLACNIVRELEHDDAYYVRQGELTFALRASYGRSKDIESPLEMVQEVDFLVLDEIGCTVLANDERLLLDEAVKHRYEQRMPTILISNLPLKGNADRPGLRDYLGDALTDRIKEATGNGKFIVQFAGESYRRTTGESYLQGLG